MKGFKAIFIPSIGPGGAERVASNLAKQINFDYLILLDDRNMSYSIPIPKERIISLNSPASKNLVRKFINLAIRYYRLKKIKQKYNITLCLSLLEPANLLNVMTKENEKVILSFHSNYSLTFLEDPFLGKGLSRNIIKFLYKVLFKSYTIRQIKWSLSQRK